MAGSVLKVAGASTGPFINGFNDLEQVRLATGFFHAITFDNQERM
jgi:hypothetical protein